MLEKIKFFIMRNNDRKKPWLEILKNCQEEIASLKPNPYYLSAYRAEEMLYWMNIPEWIYADRKELRMKRCLDIGCAYGTLALYCKRLLECEVYCTDFIDAFISGSLIDKHRFFFSRNNIELDPFPWPAGFDIILFTEVLEHLNFHPVPTLRKIRELLSPGGRVYISTPDASRWGKVDKYYSSIANMPYPTHGKSVVDEHVYVYSREELCQVIGEAGFKIEKFNFAPGASFRHFNAVLVRAEDAEVNFL